jgi:hypothetical protein
VQRDEPLLRQQVHDHPLTTAGDTPGRPRQRLARREGVRVWQGVGLSCGPPQDHDGPGTKDRRSGSPIVVKNLALHAGQVEGFVGAVDEEPELAAVVTADRELTPQRLGQLAVDTSGGEDLGQHRAKSGGLEPVDT